MGSFLIADHSNMQIQTNELIGMQTNPPDKSCLEVQERRKDQG